MRKAGTQLTVNDYEQIRNARVAANNIRLEKLGIQNIVKSMTGTQESNKSHKRKEKEPLGNRGVTDKEYICSGNDEEDSPLNVKVP